MVMTLPSSVVAEVSVVDNQPAISLSDLNILLVEDDPAARSVFKQLLEVLGCRVTEATGIKDAHSQVVRNRFDIVLTDNNLHHHWNPDDDAPADAIRLNDGLKLIQAHHEKAGACILMSGGADSEIWDKLNPKAHRLDKPFSLSKLEETLKQCLKQVQEFRGQHRS